LLGCGPIKLVTAAIKVKDLGYHLRTLTTFPDTLYRHLANITHHFIRYLSTVSQPLFVFMANFTVSVSSRSNKAIYILFIIHGSIGGWQLASTGATTRKRSTSTSGTPIPSEISYVLCQEFNEWSFISATSTLWN
jgi:hypothetical protein